MSEEERNFESEARREGWRPEGEWDGDPDKWVDAKTFVERGEKINGILRSKVDRLASRLDRAEQQNKKFGEYHRKTIERERQQAEKKIENLEGLLEKAIEDGDGQNFTRINKEINNLKNSMPNTDDSDDLDLDPTSRAWLEENPWYGKDQQLTTYADGAADRIRARGFVGESYFQELSKEVREAFPQKFENPNRKKETVGDDGKPSDSGGSPQKRTYKNLPKDAKEACDEFVTAGFMTKEEYVEQYDWEEE